MKKVLLVIVGLLLVLVLWFWTEEKDYFRANYNDLTLAETSVFEAESNPTMIYISHFGDKNYIFPRQNVDKVKLFENKPFVASLTSRTLREELNSDVVKFFNDSTNFWWGETTWLYTESEYLLRFYNKGKVVGKIYLCLDKCGMTDSRPFSPNMKFGGLTDEAQKELESIIDNKGNWR